MEKIDKSILQACIFQGWHKFILGLLIPVLVLFQLERGLSLIQIGFNMALYSVTVIILEIPSGILADFLGHKKVYMLSLYLNSLAMLMLMLTTDAVWIAISFVLWGSGRAFSSGSMEAVFINNVSTEGDNRSVEKLISYTQFAIPVGLALGALLGGILPDMRIERILIIPLSDFYALNFCTAVLLYLVLAVFFNLFVPDSTDKVIQLSAQSKEQSTTMHGRNRSEGVVSLAFSTIKGSPVFLVIMLTSLVWGFSFSGLETFWQPRVFQITGGMESTFIYGLLTNGYFLAGALGSLISWPLCRLMGNKPFIFLFSQRFVLGGMFFVLSGILELGWFSVVYIGLFLFNGTSNPVELSILNQEIPSESRATLLSVISFIMQAGGMTGALAGGILSEIIGIGFTWKVGAGLLMISSISYLLASKKKKMVTGVTNEL